MFSCVCLRGESERTLFIYLFFQLDIAAVNGLVHFLNKPTRLWFKSRFAWAWVARIGSSNPCDRRRWNTHQRMRKIALWSVLSSLIEYEYKLHHRTNVFGHICSKTNVAVRVLRSSWRDFFPPWSFLTKWNDLKFLDLTTIRAGEAIHWLSPFSRSSLRLCWR